ncbi:hypothetical protein pb186bvf_003548 [Paramecium bursaria]
MNKIKTYYNVAEQFIIKNADQYQIKRDYSWYWCKFIDYIALSINYLFFTIKMSKITALKKLNQYVLDKSEEFDKKQSMEQDKLIDFIK